MTTITVTFDPPVPSDSTATFNNKAFATLGDLNTWSSQANTVASEVNTNASTASTAAGTATTQAGIATSAASTAETQAGNASTSASAASASASAASTSATNASNSAAAAAASAASINPASIAITGGTINGASIGATTPSSVAATTISASGKIETSATTARLVGRTSGTGNASVEMLRNADGSESGFKFTIDGTTNDLSLTRWIGGGSANVMSVVNSTGAVSFASGLAVTGSVSATGTLGTWAIDSSGAVMNFSRADANYFTATAAGGYFNWRVNGVASDAMTLSASGNLGLGLGVTPSAWSAGKAIEVGYNGNAVWSYSQADQYITNNATYTDTWRFVNPSSSHASNYRQSLGVHAWSVSNAAGTAGNAITFTERMNLSSTGLSVTGSVSATKSGAGYEAAMITLATPSETSAVYRIGMGTGGNLLFGRSDVPRTDMSLDSSGNLLVGTTIVKQQLTVAGAGHFGGRTQIGTAYIGDDATSGNNVGFVFGGSAILPGNGSGSATDNSLNLGSGANRYATIYAGTGTINTSDAREKTEVAAFTTAEINAAKQLHAEIGTYKFLASIAAKGDAARTHIGMTVQRAIEIMEANGLNPFAYGFICHDVWDDGVMEHNGQEVVAGDRYGFRYDQLSLFIAAGSDARIAQLEADKASLLLVLASVDDRLAALEAK